VLKEAEAGAKTNDLCRKHGISQATFYNWKAKYGSVTVSQARHVKTLEQENSKVKRLLADTKRDQGDAEGSVGSKMVSSQARLQSRFAGIRS